MEYFLTHEEFDDLVHELACEQGAAYILDIPGVWDLVQDHFNNDALDLWYQRQPWTLEEDEEEDESGETFPTMTFSQDGFELVLRRTRIKRDGKDYVHYRLYDPDWDNEDNEPIFVGEDLGCSPMHDALSLHTVSAALDFFSLKEGDTDEEYFEKYTDRQVRWRDDRAEELQSIAVELSELIRKAEK